MAEVAWRDVERVGAAGTGVVGVTGVGVVRGRGAHVGVGRVDRRRAQVEPTGAGDRHRAGGLGRAVVDDAGRAGHDRGRGGRRDREGARHIGGGIPGRVAGLAGRDRADAWAHDGHCGPGDRADGRRVRSEGHGQAGRGRGADGHR